MEHQGKILTWDKHEHRITDSQAEDSLLMQNLPDNLYPLPCLKTPINYCFHLFCSCKNMKCRLLKSFQTHAIQKDTTRIICSISINYPIGDYGLGTITPNIGLPSGNSLYPPHLHMILKTDSNAGMTSCLSFIHTFVWYHWFHWLPLFLFGVVTPLWWNLPSSMPSFFLSLSL